MKRSLQFLLLMALVIGLAACGSGKPTPTPDVAATVAAAVQSTAAAAPTQPPPPPPATVLAPMTVVVPVTQIVVVTTTPAPVTPTPEAPVNTPRPVNTPKPADGTSDAGEPTEEPMAVRVPAPGETPQALNGPDPIAGVTGTIFQEYFSPPDFWETGDNIVISKLSDVEGQLKITNKKMQSYIWTVNGRKGQNFYFQARVQPGLCKYGDNYGLMFRVSSDQSLRYLFGISCEGRYRLLEVNGNQYTPVVDWAYSRYIARMETANVIGVRADGDQVSLYVNNYYLATATVGNTDTGRFGVYVENSYSPELAVTFRTITAARIGQ